MDSPTSPREAFHSYRYVRLLHQTGAAQDIGCDGCWLCTIVVMAEDSIRFRGPAKFWNAELMSACGFRSPKQLDTTRDMAIRAGWLTYYRADNRAIGEYRTTIPAYAADGNHSAGGMNSGMNSGTNDGMNDGMKSGKPSIPIPSPIPEESAPTTSKPERAHARFAPPTATEVAAYATQAGITLDASAFVDHFSSNGWKVGGKAPMRDWRAAARNWSKRKFGPQTATNPETSTPPPAIAPPTSSLVRMPL